MPQLVFSPYSANSKQMARSLGYLDAIIGDKPSLGYEKMVKFIHQLIYLSSVFLLTT